MARSTASRVRLHLGNDRWTTDLDWFRVVAGAAQSCFCGDVPLAALLPVVAADTGTQLGYPPLIDVIVKGPEDEDEHAAEAPVLPLAAAVVCGYSAACRRSYASV